MKLSVNKEKLTGLSQELCYYSTGFDFKICFWACFKDFRKTGPQSPALLYGSQILQIKSTFEVFCA